MSIFSQLPHDLIFRIIKESQIKSCLDYHLREKPKEHIHLMKEIVLFLKQQSDLISELSDNDYKHYKTLLPMWAMEQNFNESNEKSKIWILPYSATLLEFTMSDIYWNKKQKHKYFF